MKVEYINIINIINKELKEIINNNKTMLEDSQIHLREDKKQLYFRFYNKITFDGFDVCIHFIGLNDENVYFTGTEERFKSDDKINIIDCTDDFVVKPVNAYDFIKDLKKYVLRSEKRAIKKLETQLKIYNRV